MGEQNIFVQLATVLDKLKKHFRQCELFIMSNSLGLSIRVYAYHVNEQVFYEKIFAFEEMRLGNSEYVMDDFTQEAINYIEGLGGNKVV